MLAPKLLANVKPGGDGEIHRVMIAEGMVWLAHEGDSAVYGYDLNLNSASVPKVVLGKEQGLNKTHGLRLRPGTGHGELWADEIVRRMRPAAYSASMRRLMP